MVTRLSMAVVIICGHLFAIAIGFVGAPWLALTGAAALGLVGIAGLDAFGRRASSPLPTKTLSRLSSLTDE